MDMERLRNIIIKLLYQNLGCPVVMLNQSEERPEYPFVGYNFISTHIKSKEMGNYHTTEIPSLDCKYPIDLLETVELQPQFTISFTAYSKDSIEAKSLALKAWEFFKLGAYRPLARENIIVTEWTNIGNRDIFETEHYERREGFDVQFRTTQKIQNRLETIETYELKKEVE